MNRTEHLLSVVMEECAETAKRATKAQRFGLHETQPDQAFDNFDRIRYEYSHLVGTMQMLGIEPIAAIVKAKQEKVERYLQYSKELGTLS